MSNKGPGNNGKPGLTIEYTKKKQSPISIQPSEKKTSIIFQHQPSVVQVDRPKTPNAPNLNTASKMNRPSTPNFVPQSTTFQVPQQQMQNQNHPAQQMPTPSVFSQANPKANINQLSMQSLPKQVQSFGSQSPAQPLLPQIQTISSIPQHDAFCRLSLLSFVSSFEDQTTFNETDLSTLGLDLKCQDPLLPMLHSVLSDAPLLDHSQHPMPQCYSEISQGGKPQEKLSLFSEQTLLFIFYTYPRDPLQVQAADELQKRGYIYEEETEEWRNRESYSWSVDQWKEVEETEQGDSMLAEN